MRRTFMENELADINPPLPTITSSAFTCHIKEMSYDAEAQWNGPASPLILEM